MASHSPSVLTEAQRAQLTSVPGDLSDRDIARFYTLSPHDIAFIRQQRRNVNRLGIAVQLCMLRFPGRTLMTLPDVPVRVLRAIAQQLGIEPTAFVSYGERRATCYEHLDALKAHFGFRTLEWQDARAVMRAILPQVRWLNLSRHWIDQISVDREGQCDTKALTQVRAESWPWSPDHARCELSTAPRQGLT